MSRSLIRGNAKKEISTESFEKEVDQLNLEIFLTIFCVCDMQTQRFLVSIANLALPTWQLSKVSTSSRLEFNWIWFQNLFACVAFCLSTAIH